MGLNRRIPGNEFPGYGAPSCRGARRAPLFVARACAARSYKT
jgi:hypothetical protein